MGEGTHRLTRDLFDYEPLDPVQVKGKAEPSGSGSRRRPAAGFGAELHGGSRRRSSVGRTSSSSSAHVRARGREPSVQLVTLVGEPGVGKSRMIRELFSYIDDLPELVRLATGAVPPVRRGRHVLGARRDREGAGRHPGVGRRPRRPRQARACVAALVEEPGEREWVGRGWRPWSGWGPSADALSRRSRSARGGCSSRRSRRSAHWYGDRGPALGRQAACSSSWTHVLEWSTGYPLLILCSARPELLQRDPRVGRRHAQLGHRLAPAAQRRDTPTLLEHPAADRPPDLYEPSPSGRGQPAVRRGVRPHAGKTGPVARRSAPTSRCYRTRPREPGRPHRGAPGHAGHRARSRSCRTRR